MLKLDHAAIEVSDLDGAIKFYTETLGLELMSNKVDPIHHEAFAFLRLDGGSLELLQCLDDENQPKRFVRQIVRASNCPHLAIGTDDVDALVERLKRERIRILKGPLEIPGDVRWVYALDPDDNILEFVQCLKD
jgi:methylmalonyl-CoA mutase C-terminal domain/subunit